MSKHPVLSLRQASISFAKKILFENLDLHLFAKDRVCLIGKNGVGKTTLMNAIANRFELDCGARFQMPNSILGYLTQNEKLPSNISVEEFICQGLKLDEQKKYLIDIICDNLKIDKSALTHNLSGGQARRVHLAFALALEPDILLLDEPTNHLDLEVIEWLENYLQSYNGAMVVISHDRKFLEKISNKVFWIRAGQIKVNQYGYKNFDEWSQNIVEHEQRSLENLQKKVEMESQWLQTGVTGRRKRNIGRLHLLGDLKTKLANQRKIVNANQNSIKINVSEYEEDSPQLIMNLNNVSFEIDNNSQKLTIINKLSLKILRQERIGIIGKNGAGKSTFLKLLISEIKPSSGKIKMARDISFSYFDQLRSAIQPHKTIQEILCDSGGEYVQLPNGKTRHICGYLQDFAFSPDERETLVSTLSGGQQNRLLLAKTLANPGNFLILDEPTNDLDMDTLDILQDYLEAYQGTLIVVSHDRDFLDNIATSILAFEGNGIINQHLGGYSDYLEFKQKNLGNLSKNNLTNNNKFLNKNSQNIDSKNDLHNNSSDNFSNNSSLDKKNNFSNNQPIIFSYKMGLEQEKINEKIDKLNQKISKLSEELNNHEDYNPNDFANISLEISKHQNEIQKLENRWLELEEIREKTIQ
jgi:ATP-binding cassette subfamily F protein uup